MGGAASNPRSAERGGGAAGEAGRRRAARRRALLFPLLSRSGPRAAANYPFSNSSVESRGPRSLSRACVPLVARKAASGAQSGTRWGLGGGGGRASRGPSRARGLPPALGPALPPAAPNGFIHSFLSALQIFTECPRGAQRPAGRHQGAEERIHAGPPLPALAVRTGRWPERDRWDSDRVEEAGGVWKLRENLRRLPEGGDPQPL